jgi:SAM-dependent methyltransferase
MPPRGPRDSRHWYLEADPLAQVDERIVDFVDAHAGQSVLDLGCATGGYSLALSLRGRAVRALDVSEEYVQRARDLGVAAEAYDGESIPIDDDGVDTVILVEVLEHLDEPGRLLAEAHRVARRGVLVTTPNSTQSFEPVPVEFSHMLDVDHRQQFTVASLRDLLAGEFGSAVVEQAAAVDAQLAGLVAPRPLRPLIRLIDRAGLVRPRFFSRLLGRAPA